MTGSYISKNLLPDFINAKRGNTSIPDSFEFEITARCNCNCRHCHIRQPAGSEDHINTELPLGRLIPIIDDAADLGILWCLITGGEPLIRNDFADIYRYLKKKGFLVSVFTNATLITSEHVDLFKKYPPRELEVTVYGVTKETYERVTQTPGSFEAFRNGLRMLLDAGIKVNLKSMAMQSNFNELEQIRKYCEENSKNSFRFDPYLNLRYDRNALLNKVILSERLSAEKIKTLELADPERCRDIVNVLENENHKEKSDSHCNHIFRCGAGTATFTIDYKGAFRLCSCLTLPVLCYDLENGSLTDAIYNFVPKIRSTRSEDPGFLEKCRICTLINICMWCPAKSYLETGLLDTPEETFCELAHSRVGMLKNY